MTATPKCAPRFANESVIKSCEVIRLSQSHVVRLDRNYDINKCHNHNLKLYLRCGRSVLGHQGQHINGMIEVSDL